MPQKEVLKPLSAFTTARRSGLAGGEAEAAVADGVAGGVERRYSVGGLTRRPIGSQGVHLLALSV